MTDDDASEFPAPTVRAHDAIVRGDPADGAFEGAPAFAAALLQAMRHADERGARVLRWCDDDFSAWPLGDATFVAHLTHWAKAGGRQLQMVAANWDDVPRRHPRFVRWRQDWDHVVTCLEPTERHDDPLPTLWLDAADQVVRVFDREHWRGRVGADRVDRQRAQEQLDAITQRATPAFPASTLGL